MAKQADRTEVEVHMEADELGVSHQVGTLNRHAIRTDLAPSFEYHKDWLKSQRAFLLDPRLELYRGEQHPPSDARAFGVFMDSAPDRWGRVLMERREAAAAQREERKMRALQEIDFLLGVHDFTRVGALRFRHDAESPFLDCRENAAPPATDLKELAYISKRVEEPGVEKLPEYEQWLAMLIAPGTSLGGARPKANFTDDDGRLWLAKFPANDDRHDVGAWEYIVHRLAKRAHIIVPDSRLEKLTDRYGTFCVARFDRMGESRRMYSSAMTLLEWRDGTDGASYLDLAEFIVDNGAQGHVDEDLAQLFRRVVFNVLVANRDDHLRNHGFIREPTGWRLSAAFDINPSLAKAEHALTLDGNSAAPDMPALLATAELYRLTSAATKQIVDEVTAVVAGWKAEANRIGLPSSEIQRMDSVFLQV